MRMTIQCLRGGDLVGVYKELFRIARCHCDKELFRIARAQEGILHRTLCGWIVVANIDLMIDARAIERKVIDLPPI